MSTEVDVKLLRSLHRILRQKTDLQGRIKRGPAKIQVAKNAEAAFKTTLDDLNDLLKTTRMNAERKQLQLQEREARIEDLNKKRNACESNREYQLLTDQIAADEQANSVQSDEILELLVKVDDIQEQVRTAESELEKGKLETAKVQALVDKELASLQADFDSVNTDLEAAEALLPLDVKPEYGRLVTALGEDALAEVADNSCGHCYTTVTTQVISQLMMNRVTFCKSCGSLLYLPAGAAV